jgi:hypothetical protein
MWLGRTLVDRCSLRRSSSRFETGMILGRVNRLATRFSVLVSAASSGPKSAPWNFCLTVWIGFAAIGVASNWFSSDSIGNDSVVAERTTCGVTGMTAVVQPETGTPEHAGH